MCSTVASSPILAVQFAERALTARHYCQNHLLTLSVNVIGSASAGAAQHGTYVSQFLQIPSGFFYCSERIRANFLPTLHHWCNTPLSGALIALRRASFLQVASFPSPVAPTVKCSVYGIPRSLRRRPATQSPSLAIPVIYMFMSQLIILAKILKPNPTFTQMSS